MPPPHPTPVPGPSLLTGVACYLIQAGVCDVKVVASARLHQVLMVNIRTHTISPEPRTENVASLQKEEWIRNWDHKNFSMLFPLSD